MALKPLDIAIFGGLAAAFATVVYLMASAPEGDAEWEAYAKENHCTPVGATDGSNRGGWKCDDGKVHYRWRQQR
jgi:hypothetical protein